MLDRLRRALAGRPPSNGSTPPDDPAADAEVAADDRARIDQLVHEAVALRETVLLRRLDAVAAEVAQVRAELESGLRGGKEHTEAAVEVAERKLIRRIDLLRRAIEPAAARSTAAPTDGPTPTPADVSASAIDASLYVALEDRFRGDPAMIEARQRAYLPQLGSLVDEDHPLLDIGSGRGEWLRVLAEAGIPARGIDTNPVAVAECREAGLQVIEADVASHLDSLADGSLGAVTLFQVVEHLPFPLLVSTLRSAARVLRPGGVLLAETPNALNLRVAATNFWIDPTHQRPLHPEVLVFLALESGFAEVERVYANRIGPDPVDLQGLPAEAAELLRRLGEDVDGPGDFCLVARTPPADRTAPPGHA